MSESSTLRIHTRVAADVPATPVVVQKKDRKKRKLFTEESKNVDTSSAPHGAASDSLNQTSAVGQRPTNNPDGIVALGHLPLKGKAIDACPSPPKGFPSRGSCLAKGQTDEVESSVSRGESKRKQRKAKKSVTEKGAPRKSGFSDRLLRNSAVACAVLLGVLALGNIDQPWAAKARDGIERALTMRIDLDDSLGELTFVRKLMPESALVFLNVNGAAAMVRPTDGAITHPWSSLQPWTLYDSDGAEVRAAGAGTVTAVSPLSDGQFGVLIDHGEGLESVYANLTEVSVASGDAVNRGDALGVSGDSLYFELREGGEPIDPAAKVAL